MRTRRGFRRVLAGSIRPGAGFGLAAFGLILAFIIPAWRELSRPRPMHRARPPRKPAGGPGMPIPMWTRYEPPPPILIDLGPSDGGTVTLDPIKAEIETEWAYRPWEHETGWFTLEIERLGR